MNRFLSLAALALGVLVLARPQAAASGFADGIALCLSAVLPVLFPFFVVCELLIGSRLMSVLAKPLRWLCRIAGLRTPAAPAFLLLSWLGGYAASAQTLGQMSRRLPRREAALLMVLGCCSGPGFVIGCVGGLLLGSVRLGILLYAAQLAANWIGAAAAVPFLPSAKQVAPLCSCTGGSTSADVSRAVSLPAAISHAVDSSLSVCGCVVFFRLLSSLVNAGPFLTGVLEISAGCSAFAAQGGRFTLYGCCFCLSILSLSVWCQIILLLKGKVPLLPLAVSRAVHLVVFAALVRFCVQWLPGAETVFSSLTERVIPSMKMPADAAVISAIFLCAALYKAKKRIYNTNIVSNKQEGSV